MGVREKVGGPGKVAERWGNVELEFMGQFCWGATGGIDNGKILGQGECARVLLLTFGGQAELVDFAGGVESVVVRFEEFNPFSHKVLIFEGSCHG